MDTLPYELVREIGRWLHLFYRRDATDRVIAFRANPLLQPLWAAVMATVKATVPRYTFFLRTRSGQPLRVSVYSPDCNPEMWPGLSTDQPIVSRTIGPFYRTQQNEQVVFQNDQ